MRVFSALYGIVFILLVMFPVLGAADADIALGAEGIHPAPEAVLLDDVLEAVMRTNPGMKAAAARVEKARLQIEKANQLRYLTRLDLLMTGGLLPGHDPFSSLKDWGGFVRSEVAFVQPLFTFGKINSAVSMAEHGLGHEQAKYAELSDKAAFELICLYQGLATAQKGALVAGDMKRDFDKLLDQVDSELEDDDTDLTELDRLDIHARSWQIHKVYISTMEEHTNLMRALNIALGADEEQEIRVAGASIPECNISATNFSYLVQRVVERSPGLRSIREALAAANARIALEEANARPDIFLGGGVRLNWASNRPSDDDYNSKGVAAFVGIRWRFDFWRMDTEADIAKSDRDAVRDGLRFAEERVRLDIDKAVSDLRQEYLLLGRIRDSLAAAKTYVRIASDNYDLGLGSSQTVVNGYKTQYEIQAAELQSEYKVHVALARLALALGDIKKYEEWIRHEKVILD